MYEAGLIHGEALLRASDIPALLKQRKDERQAAVVTPSSLTWAGHELLETIREDEIWSQTKADAKMLGSNSLEVLFEIARGHLNARLAVLPKQVNC